jgi:hypothetical protein
MDESLQLFSSLNVGQERVGGMREMVLFFRSTVSGG